MQLHSVTAVLLALAIVATGLGAASPGIGQYHDIDRALADGYVPGSPCVPGMGFHYVNLALIDGDVKVSDPEILVYAYNDADELELVAAEYFVPGEDSEFALFGGHSHYHEHLGGHAMHAWFFLPNEDGLTAEFNSRVDETCHID